MSHTDVGQVVIEASPHEVFAALVDEGARTAWLPPAGMSGSFSRFDARQGGGYRMTLVYDDETSQGKSGAHVDIVDAQFIAVEEPRRLVEEVEFESDDPALSAPMTMTWTLDPVDEGTLVVITATDVPDAISTADHEKAFASTLSNLRAHVVRRDESPGL